MMNRDVARCILCWSAALAILAPATRGEIIPVSTLRRVSYQINLTELNQPGQSRTETVLGPDSGPWSSTIAGRLNPAVFTFLQAGAEAEQTSAVALDRITANTRIGLMRQQDGSNGLGSTNVRADSSIEFTFDVTTPTPIVFEAEVSPGPGVNEFAISASFSRLNGQSIDFLALAVDPDRFSQFGLTVRYEATLEPGRYSARAYSVAGITDPNRGALLEFNAFANFSLTVIPAPTPALALTTACGLLVARRRRPPLSTPR